MQGTRGEEGGGASVVKQASRNERALLVCKARIKSSWGAPVAHSLVVCLPVHVCAYACVYVCVYRERERERESERRVNIERDRETEG